MPRQNVMTALEVGLELTHLGIIIGTHLCGWVCPITSIVVATLVVGVLTAKLVRALKKK